jgi:hypothetical protein
MVKLERGVAATQTCRNLASTRAQSRKQPRRVPSAIGNRQSAIGNRQRYVNLQATASASVRRTQTGSKSLRIELFFESEALRASSSTVTNGLEKDVRQTAQTGSRTSANSIKKPATRTGFS